MTASAPITERRYIAPLILVTTLFFLWALGVNLNDVLIPHLKKVFDLNDFQSALIQVAFFGGYCFSALPAGRLLEKIGYKYDYASTVKFVRDDIENIKLFYALQLFKLNIAIPICSGIVNVTESQFGKFYIHIVI